ncbi:MAG: glycosyltransferase family 4 protein [Lachnospiraceae bacterium]|nr:glycosyltransferase family 4 protein [Lachnospiraceae bacterium]
MIKNIVFFIQNFSRPAGSERVTSIIASELSKRGYDVTILSICGDNTCFFELDEKVRLYTLIDSETVDNKKQFFKVIHKLSEFYRNNKTDIVIDVFAALSIYTILLKKRFGLKNITWEHFNYKINTGMNRLGRQLAVRYSDQIVTLTKTDMEYYIESNKIRGKITYIYNPSPYQNVDLTDIEKERKNLIISVGRLTYQKGFDRLIEVWRLVEPKCDWELLILGDGEEREKLQDQIDKYGLKRIKLMGNVKHIEEYYRKASIYVSTARYEGLPMTMIEAQSFGLPIISFDYDTGPKEIIFDEKDGIIIHKDEDGIMIKNMSEKLVKCIGDVINIQKMNINARIKSKEYDMENIINRWLEVVENIV